MRQVKNQYLKEMLDEVKSSITGLWKQIWELWTLPLRNLRLVGSPFCQLEIWTLKQEWVSRCFETKVRLGCSWDALCMCLRGHFPCGSRFGMRTGWLVIQRHNELRDLEAELLSRVFKDVKVEPLLQDISWEELNGGVNTAPNVWLDIVSRGFWDRQRPAFFDVRVCLPNTDSYRNMDPDNIQATRNWEDAPVG